MQAVLTNLNLTENNLKCELSNLFEQLENADNVLKSSIENKVVSFGNAAIEFLINKLVASRGTQRGVAAMSLIRIGESSIQPLRKLACENKNYNWVANYIIKEIKGTF